MNKSIALFSLILCFFTLGCNKGNAPVKGDESWSFVVLGDVRSGYGIYEMLVDRIKNIQPAPKMAFCLGDIMTAPGNEVEWANFNRYSKPLTDKMPLYVVRGNHDGNDTIDDMLLHEYGNVPGPDFYFGYKYKDTYFLILDTEIKGEENMIAGEQLLWLKEELSSATADPSISNIFVMLHRPLYSQACHAGEHLINADTMHQVFIHHDKVRAVLAGHEHLFKKYYQDSLLYIITAGGGSTLCRGFGGDYYHFTKISFCENSKRINIKTIGIFNEVVEDFDL